MFQSSRGGYNDKVGMNLTPLLVFLLWTIPLCAQTARNNAVLAEIHKRLTSSEKLTYHSPFLFVGEISRLGPVPQVICKQAVNQEVEFAISQLLFGGHPEAFVRTGYVNCAWQTFPSPPFTLHAKLIVYCERFHHSLTCLTPAEFTNEPLRKVKSWIAVLKDNES